MTNFTELAMSKKPEDFKVAVEAELKERLRVAVNDKREEVAREIFGEELVNKHDKTEKKPEPGTSSASDPKAAGGKSNGEIVSHEKKTGDKKAAEPKTSQVKEEADDEEKDDDKSDEKKGFEKFKKGDKKDDDKDSDDSDDDDKKD